MLRGKESSNRIELSRLVQDLLNFGDSGSLWLWRVGDGWMGVGDGLGVPPTYVHMHMHACTHTHTHANGCPNLGEPWEFPMMSYTYVCACACMHMCACACVWRHPLTTTHPPAPRGDPWNQSKFNST